MLNTLQPNADNLLPFVQLASTDEKAQTIKQLLLELSRLEADQQLKSACRQTAEFFREKFFGLTDRQIRSRVTEILKDYFDGETYNALEIDNLCEQTGIKEDVLLPVIEKMVSEGILIQGRRRRWQEYGEHYNAIYKLNK